MKKFLAACLGILAASSLFADRLTLTDGSVINGTVKSITGGTAVIATDFAGEISVPADKIVKLNTVEAVEVATAEGTRFSGSLAAEGSAAAAVNADITADNAIALPLSDIKFLWTPGMEDPTLPPSRKWNGEFSVDIAGKTGNTEKFDAGAGVIAKLTGPVDLLKLYANATYGRENHKTNTKKYVAGADYERKLFDSEALWYVNAEVEHQTTSGIRLREEIGTGLGYYLIDEEHTKLRVRAGLTAKSRKFTDGSHNDGFGGEAGLHYEHDIQEWGKWVTDLTYQPSFDNLDDYRFLHESALDIPVLFQYPLALRLGVSNEYNSKTAPGTKRMETAYFAKMVFKWK